MALDPNIIMQAGNFAKIDPAQLLETRAQLGMRNTALAKAQRDEQLAAAKTVRLGQIGSIAATGDYAGAQKAALQSGDFDLVEHVNKLDDRSKASLAAKVGIAAPVFATALTELDPAKRTQIIAAAIPSLKANGYTDDEIAKINPTDEFLRGAVANAQSIGDIIKHQEFVATEAGKAEDRALRRDDQRLDRENSRGNAYISAGLLPPDAGGVGAGVGGGGDTFSRMLGLESGGNQFARGGGVLTSPKGALGIAQLMPATAPEAARLAGVPFDAERLRNDPEYNKTLGRAYFQSLQQRYGGDDSKAAAAYNAGMGRVDAAIARGGGNWLSMLPAETRNYVTNLGGNASASAGGVRVIPGGKLDKSGDDLSASALERAAVVYGRTGQMPQGLGRGGVTQKAILNKWDEIASKGGTTPDEQIANWQTQKASGKALQAFASGPQGNTVRSLNVAIDHLDTLQNAAQALQNGNIQIFNKVAQKFAQATGRTAPANFEAIRGIVGDELVKAIVGGGNAGALADREEMKATINAAQSPQQLAGVIAEFKKLMGGQLSGLRDQYRSSTGRNDFDNKLSKRTRVALGLEKPGGRGTLSANVPTMTPEQARAAPKGTRFKTVDGRVMVRQ